MKAKLSCLNYAAKASPDAETSSTSMQKRVNRVRNKARPFPTSPGPTAAVALLHEKTSIARDDARQRDSVFDERSFLIASKWCGEDDQNSDVNFSVV